MEQPAIFVRKVMLDMAIVAVVTGLLGWIAVGFPAGVSVFVGCLWVATNFFLLAWLVRMVLTPSQAPGLFIFLVACAKLPASYFLLWWLYQVEFFEPAGVTIGICLLPAVLLVRGLVSIRKEGKHQSSLEEGS